MGSDAWEPLVSTLSSQGGTGNGLPFDWTRTCVCANAATAYFWTVALSSSLVLFADIRVATLLLWVAVCICLVDLLNCGACATAPTRASHVRHAAWHPACTATLALVGLGYDGLHSRHTGRCQLRCPHPAACIG